MVPLLSLWLPVLLAALLVFIVSAVIHTLLPKYHHLDFRKLPQEDAVQGALRAAGVEPGEYVLPFAGGMKQMREHDYLEKVKRGPVALLTVIPGECGMARSLILWFVYCVVVGTFAAYLAGRALGPGASFLEAFRFASCAAFAGYALALWQDAIWFNRRISTTLKYTLDGVIYALLTGGVFGWLWPA